MSALLRYVIAFVVGSHAFIYLRLGPSLPAVVTQWHGPSLLLRQSVTGHRFKILVAALHVTAGILLLASAVAIGFGPSLPGWWRPLAISGAAFGLAAFASFWDGQSKYLFHEGAIGALISLILLASAVMFPRAFG